MVGVIVIGVRADRVDQYLGGEDVVAHRDERRVGVVESPGRLQRLFDETADSAGLVGVNASERMRVGARNPDAGHRSAGPAVDVEPDHLLGVHPVNVIGSENHYVVRIFVVDQVERLIDRIGGASVPAGPQALLGRHRVMYSPARPDSRQFCEMWRSSECDLYWVRTQILRYRAFTRFDSTKSISR